MGALKTKVLDGLKWSTGGRGAQIIIQIVQYAILARLLTPQDFGLFSMANIVIGFAMQLGDAGLTTAIIQSKDLDRKKFSTLYYLSIIIGIIIFALINLTKGFVTLFFDAVGLPGLLFLGSFIFLIMPIGKQYQTLFQKELKFETIVKIELLSKIFGASTSIVLAVYGLGAKSIIWGLIVNNSVRFIYFFIRGNKEQYKLAISFRLKEVKSEINFGLNHLGATFTNYFGSRMDKILIGRFLGEASLGFYEIAYQLVLLPMFNINPILNRIALPSFSIIQDDIKKVKKHYFNAIEYINLFVVPLMIGISFTAEPLVLILYGEQWHSSIILVQILAIVALFKVIGNPYGNVLLALGKAHVIFYWEVYVTLILTIAVFVAVHHSIVFVAYALLIIQTNNFVLKYFWLVKPVFRHVGYDYFVRNFILQVLYCAPMIMVLLLINMGVSLAKFGSMGLSVCLAALTYSATLLIFEKKKLTYILNNILNKSNPAT